MDELFNQSMSHLDNIKFHFSNPDGLLHVQLTKARVRYPGVRSLPALQSESGIRPCKSAAASAASAQAPARARPRTAALDGSRRAARLGLSQTGMLFLSLCSQPRTHSSD